MKLNNKGWGYRMMAVLMATLCFFLLVAIYYIYLFYNGIENGGLPEYTQTTTTRKVSR